MCTTCGCATAAKSTILNLQTSASRPLAHGAIEHEHVHADGTRHSHAHGDAHDHTHGHAGETRHSHAPYGEVPGSLISLEARILEKNDGLATRNRAWLAARQILMLNLVSSPGSGKTTLLERTICDLKNQLALFVIEGDQATANDARRIKAAGAPAVQVNTGTGCHLEADMVARGLAELRPNPNSVVLVENVGNLVCPALFDLGEAAKVVILSVTEGDDKPAKYPHMFKAAGLVIITKLDLLPHVEFSIETAMAHARAVNPGIGILAISAKTGEGLEDWYSWLASRRPSATTTITSATPPGG